MVSCFLSSGWALPAARLSMQAALVLALNLTRHFRTHAGQRGRGLVSAKQGRRYLAALCLLPNRPSSPASRPAPPVIRTSARPIRPSLTRCLPVSTAASSSSGWKTPTAPATTPPARAASWNAGLAAGVWDGLKPDASPRQEDEFGPYTQSQRSGLHRQYAEQLLASGAAYRAFDTPEELNERRKAAEARKDSYLGYDRRDRHLSLKESDRRAAAGEAFVIRLAAPLDGQTVVRDRLRGDVVFQNAELDDKVLLKRDGFPTYHLAAMVDDHLMGVTHVIRAEEWLTSTPIHQLILQGLGWNEPEWIHTPWLLSKGGKKYSKRRGDPSVEDFRKLGILPEALLNYLGMMGWSMPSGEDGAAQEVFSPEEMVQHFTWERVSLGGSTFDVEKLRWLNGKYIREVLALGDVVNRVHAFGRSRATPRALPKTTTSARSSP